jgi:hypothetical protein
LNGHCAAWASAEPLEKRREHDQLTFIAFEAMKVSEAFQKNNACAQEGFVDTLLGIVDRAGGGSVHTQKRNSTISQMLGGLQGQTGKILKKERRAVVEVPPRSQENPCTRRKHFVAGLKVLACDPVLISFFREIEDDSLADERFEGNLIQRHPAFDDMRRSIQMGSKVVAEANRLDRIPILLEAFNLPELRP